MFEAKLALPRKKKRPRYAKRHKSVQPFPECPVLQQPFPIPISSLTGIRADNSVWRWYKGKLSKRIKFEDQDKANNLQITPDQSNEHQDTKKLYYYVEITPDNEAHSILSQMGFFGETDENLVSYRSTSKGEGKHDSYVVMDDFIPKITVGDKSELIKNEKLRDSVPDNSQQNDEQPGYLRLELWEAFFLSYGLGCLLISDCDSDNCDEDMSIDDMWDKFCKVHPSFPQKYAVYHHFRSKGWVVKNGCKFGADYLLYKDGPPFYHASYSVWIRQLMNNDENSANIKELPKLDWTSLSGLNRVTESASKELLLVDIHEPNDVKDKMNTITDYINCIRLEEVLVRRWVASSEKQDVD